MTNIKIKLAECLATSDFTQGKVSASEVLDLDQGCGLYCCYVGEACEDRGIKVYYNGKLLKEKNECACGGKCFESAGYSMEFIEDLRKRGWVG